MTLMRLRRSLFFAAPATPSGRSSGRKPGETVKALLGRPGCGLPGAPMLLKPVFRPMWRGEVRERAGSTRCEPPTPVTRPLRFFTYHGCSGDRF